MAFNLKLPSFKLPGGSDTADTTSQSTILEDRKSVV